MIKFTYHPKTEVFCSMYLKLCITLAQVIAEQHAIESTVPLFSSTFFAVPLSCCAEPEIYRSLSPLPDCTRSNGGSLSVRNLHLRAQTYSRKGVAHGPAEFCVAYVGNMLFEGPVRGTG
jgi:hypothetical protein